MKKKISEFISQQRTNLMDQERGYNQKQIDEPLLEYQTEGGTNTSPIRQSRLSDLSTGERFIGSNKEFCQPEKITLQESDLNFLDKTNRVKTNQIHYEIFKQAFFDIPVQSFDPDTTSMDIKADHESSNEAFNIQNFSSELTDTAKNGVFRPLKKKNAMEMTLLSNKELRFKQVLDYVDERPAFDSNKDQKLFDIYMEEFESAVAKHQIFKAKDDQSFEETDLNKAANEAIILEEEHNIEDNYATGQQFNQNDTIIHKTLLCSGNFSSQNWLVESRKTFYKGEPSRLHLELAQFTYEGNKKSMGAMLLHTYHNSEFMHLFNGNAECLFNLIQVHEKIYYFAIEKSDQDVYEEYNINLKQFGFEDEANLENASQNKTICQIQVSKNEIDKNLQGGTLMGAIFIKGTRATFDKITGLPICFFALIYAIDGNEPKICYDVRHTSQPEHTLMKSVIQVPISTKDKTKFFSNKEPVLIQLSFNKILDQMTLTGKLPKDEKRRILIDIDQKRQQAQKKRIQTMLHNKQKSKDSSQQTIENIQFEMFIVGSLNDLVYDKVHEFFFIDKNLDAYNQGNIMKQQDINDTKDMLVESLRMLCFKNTCNVIKFNSNLNKPETFEKLKCRGQIELVKRLLINKGKQVEQPDDLATKEKEAEVSDDISGEYAQYSDRDTTQISKTIISTDVERKQSFDKSFTVQKEYTQQELQQGLKSYGCCSIIDNVNRLMTINFYHKNDSQKQFVLQLSLNNLSVTWNKQLNKQESHITAEDTSIQGYNKMFFNAFKRIHQNDQDSLNPKFIISKKFDNIARDVYNIYWIPSDEQQSFYVSKDHHYSVTQLRSKFQILSEQTYNDSKIEQIAERKEKHEFIYCLINDNKSDRVKTNDHFVVTSFRNFTNNQMRQYFENEKLKQIDQQNKLAKGKGQATQVRKLIITSDDEMHIDLDKNMKFTSEVKQKKYKNVFTMKDRFMILQNCIFVEDDREDIPFVCVGNNFRSVQFGIMRYDQIKAIVSLRVTQEEIAQSIEGKKPFNQIFPDLIQFCASSDIQEGYDQDGTTYMFQNFTVAIKFPKMYRYRMNEYQVKWIPNKDQLTKDKSPFHIKITFIKLRDIIYKKKSDNNIIDKYMIVPLFEVQEPLEKSSQIISQEKKSYKIVGIQFMTKLKGGQICYTNFRNLTNDQYDSETKKFNEVNFHKRMFLSTTKIINQQFISGVYAETQFKHIIDDDLTSDTINSKIFKNSQSFSLLREANMNVLNSIPLDFIGLMDMPLINHEWYQNINRESLEDHQMVKPLQTIDLLNMNYKRYFNPWQALQGFQMLNQLGIITEATNQGDFQSILVKKEESKGLFSKVGTGMGEIGLNPLNLGQDEPSKVNRDPSQIVYIFSHLNEQQDDRLYDFKHLKDMRTPMFELTLIERALVNDDKVGRFISLRKKGLVMDGKDPICSNMDLQSVIQYPLDNKDNKMADIYLKELYENNQFSINKYSQMMRIMPMILDKKLYSSMEYFKFFIDADMQFQNDDVDRDDQVVDQDEVVDDDMFKGEELPDYITFSQFFPVSLQEQIDSYTDKRVQIFTEETSKNLNNLQVTSTLRQQFNLLSQEYQSEGSKYEVLASQIDFKPYILGKKLHALEVAKSIDQIKEIKEVTMDDYVLSNMVSRVMELTKGKIDEQKAIRDIIDYQYQVTKRFFYINLFLYTFGYFLPLIYQMKSGDRQRVLICNVSCLVMQVYCLIYEAISIISDGYKIYFQSWWNFIDCLTIVTYFVYFFVRLDYLDSHIIPTMHNFDEKKDAQKIFDFFKKDHDEWVRLYSPLIHVLLITTAFLKLMYYLRCNSEFGQFVQLVISCCYDVKIFIFFFVSWVMIFSYLFMVVGSTFGQDDYPLLPGLAFYFQTYRNSIGDIAPPEYKYWEGMHDFSVKEYKEHPTWGYSQCMVYLVWILWFLNQFFNLIILLNFLIAIVSQSYDRVISESINYQYSHKSELNEETQRFFKVFRKPVSFDIMCIISSHEDDTVATDQIQGLSYTIKLYVKNQVLKLQDEVIQRFDRSDKATESLDDKMRKYIDEKFVENIESVAHVKKILNQIQAKIDTNGVGNEEEVGESDKKIDQMMNFMRDNQILLEKVASKQNSDKQELTTSINKILEENSESDLQASRRAEKAQEETEKALNQVQQKLAETLQQNEDMKMQLKASQDEIGELTKMAVRQDENYSGLSQDVQDINQNLAQEVNKSVQDMTGIFDEKINALKDIIDKQNEEDNADQE